EGGSKTGLALDEGEDVELEPRDRGRVTRSASGRDVHDVEGCERCNHRNGETDRDLIAEHRDSNSLELGEPTGAIEPRRFVERGVDFAHAGEQEHGAETRKYPDANHPDCGKRRIEVAEPGPGHVVEPDRRANLVDEASA